jgi:hypothetical protein
MIQKEFEKDGVKIIVNLVVKMAVIVVNAMLKEDLNDRIFM